MAGTSVLKLKVDDKEYNASLKQAQQGMQHLEQALKDAGKSFTQVDKSVVDYVRSIGQMEVQSKTARGRISEMSNAFVEFSLLYKNMSDEVKSSDVGKVLSESIEQLKNRTIDAKNELENLNNELNNVKMPEVKEGGGGLFSGLGDKMSGALQVFAGNMLTKGVSMLTSELSGSVQESIELARQGEGIRMAFERLNRPGLLDELKAATHGTVSEIELMQQAIKFENFKLPVEDLANYLAFAQQKAKDTGESIDYLVNSIVTGLGRQSKQILDNLGISASELTSRMNEGATMTQAVSDIIREEMAKAGDYVETAADRAARATADATNEMEKLGQQAMPVAEEFTSSFNEIKIAGMELINLVLTPLANSARSIKKILSGDFNFKEGIPNLADGGKSPWGGWKPGTDNTVKAAGGYVEITDSNTGAIIGGSHFDNLNDANSINAWKKSLFKSSSGRGSKNNIPEYLDFYKQLFKSMSGESLKSEFEHISPFEIFKDRAKFDPENILGSKDAWEKYKDTITGSISSIGESMSNLTEWTADFDPYKNKMESLTKAAKQQQMAFAMAGESANNFGAALASLDDPAAKAAGTVISAIANIALGFGQAVASAGSMGPWAWLAYVAAGTAALATTISTVHSLTGYAQGGMIKGNSYSGDNIGGLVDGSQLVGLNAGELVLNAAQQNNVAQNLEGAGARTVRVVGKIHGTDIILSADRTLMEQGKQLAVWGRG